MPIWGSFRRTTKQLLGLVCPKALTFKDQDATIHGLVKQKNE